MNSDRNRAGLYGSQERPIRTDRDSARRPARPIRSDADARRRHQAGEYGEGREHEATGVGPRHADTPAQVLDDTPGYADNYGNVEPGRYGIYGYSGSPGHPSAYVEGSANAADERLRELIRQRLTEDPAFDAGDVIIAVSDGQVTLSGTVADAHVRDIIEQCVENCGAKAVANHLSVA